LNVSDLFPETRNLVAKNQYVIHVTRITYLDPSGVLSDPHLAHRDAKGWHANWRKLNRLQRPKFFLILGGLSVRSHEGGMRRASVRSMEPSAPLALDLE
jgi:hypothetical protein